MQHIHPDASTLHGYFSRERAPILSISSGESVRFTVPDANWQDYHNGELQLSPHMAADPMKGHAMCGPIAIEGAKKGMVLEVEIGSIRSSPLGWNRGGGKAWEHWERLGVAHLTGSELVYWELDQEAGFATNKEGFRVQMAPFMGVLGMPPDEPGQHSTVPPRYCGGNIDCKHLVAGSRLFLPIPVDGALFSVGDGHAAQGDGEVSGTAIECAIEQVDLSFRLHPEMMLSTPRAHTAQGWLTFGFHENLNEASYIALNAMLDLMMELYPDADRAHCMALASLTVDMQITQIVNQVNGVHAFLPHGAIMHVGGRG